MYSDRSENDSFISKRLRSVLTHTYIKMICIEKSKKIDHVMLHNYTVSDLIVATDDF